MVQLTHFQCLFACFFLFTSGTDPVLAGPPKEEESARNQMLYLWTRDKQKKNSSLKLNTGRENVGDFQSWKVLPQHEKNFWFDQLVC